MRTITCEKEFSAWLVKKLPGHVQRVENTVGNGVPDINVCYKEKEYWIETKVAAGAPLLRKEQYAWGTRRAKEGGIVEVWSYDTDIGCVFVYEFPVTVKKVRRYLRITSGPITILNLESVSKFLG